MGAYDDLVPTSATTGGAYDDLVPQRGSTIAGGPKVSLPSAEASREYLQERAPELGVPGMLAARGGKTLLAAFADLASAIPGGTEPSLENLRAYAKNPEAPLPVEEAIADMKGIGSVPTKAAAGLIRATPAIGASMLLGGAGVPAPLAAAMPLSADERGVVDPAGAVIAAALPGAAKAGEAATAYGLSRLPMKEVAITLSRDPLRLKGKVVQQFGPIDLSNDVYRQWLEAGGGAVTANAFLLATQAPGILELPPEQRGEAVLDSMAANVGPSLLGFAARRPVSLTLERMAPDILAKARDAIRGKAESPRGPRGPQEPAEEGAVIPPGEPVRTPEPSTGYEDLVPAAEKPISPSEPPPEPPQSNQERPNVQKEMQEEGQPVAPKPAPVTEGGSVLPEPAPAEPAPAPPADSPKPQGTPVGENLASWVSNSLQLGRKVERGSVIEMGRKFGLTDKESEEWAELGSTEAARAIAQDPEMTNRETFLALVSLYDRIPRSSERSLDTKVNQQYSTPPPLAFLGSVLADFAGGTAFADVTAGHGMLMIGASPGSRVVLNELDPGRAQRLARFARGYKALLSNGDATDPELLRTLLRDVDRLGLNPPFGTVLDAQGKNRRFPLLGSKTTAKDTSSLDAAIPLNSLELAKPNTKAFVIIGAKTGTPFAAMSEDPASRAKAYKKREFLELFDRFNVVDWFTVGGDLYRKMGAGWPVDMIIVHGKGKTKSSKDGGLVRPWMSPPRVIERWEDLLALIPENAYDNIQPGGTSTGSAGGGAGGTDAGAGGGEPAGPGEPEVPSPRPEPPTASSGGGDGGGSSKPDAGPTRAPTPAPPVVPGDSSAGIGKGTPEPPQPVAGGGTETKQPQAAGVGGSGAVPPRTTDAPPGVVSQPPTEGLPASLLVPYVGVSKGPSLNLVAPRNIAGQMLGAQRALEKELGMSADQFVAERLGRDVATLHAQLAGAQIDAVALAIRNIERGTGLITADETGVGKGRMVAALMEYARMRGLVPVFVTAKKNLYTDMVARDLRALGNPDFKPFITDNSYYLEDGRGRETKVNRRASAGADLMASVVRTGELPEGAHAIFTTYSQLGSDKPPGWKETPKDKFARKNDRQSKPDGPRWAMLRAIAPRGIFILDEAHLAAGKDSEVNLKFEGILPAARGTYYSSATFAKRPDNLGLYALGTSIRLANLDAEHLTEALTEGGVPMQQALTSMLAETGELVRRQQDWTGVEMRFKATSVNPEKEIEAADTYTSFIRDLMTLAKQVNRGGSGLADGENQTAPEDVTVSLEPITFGSRLFNLSNQYLLALRSQAISAEAIAQLRAGKKPFIALYNTMEGPILDLKARKLPLTFAGMLRREMAKMLVITIRDPRVEGGRRKVEIQPEDLPDGGAFYRELERQIDATDFSGFPISPIDSIKRTIQEAGYSVAELTARDGQVDDTGEEAVVTKRERVERTKVLRSYNDGDVDALIVNGSGSTGLSAHSAPEFKDKRQRVMVVGQPAPDINEFMQMLGRVMRSGQLSKPIYRILTTALAAERRFATMLRGKMTSLNANTTAEGESGMTQAEGFSEDIFNEVGDRVVYRVMEANEDLLDTLDMALPEGEPDEGFARYVTGRFVLLPNGDAQRLWDEIIAEYVSEIEQLNEAGQNPLRAVAEDLRARTVESTELVAGTGSTPFDGPAVLEKAVVKPPKAPPKHTDVLAEAKAFQRGARDRVMAWLAKSKAAEQERLTAARQRGAADAQLDKIERQFEQVRQDVMEAYRLLGDTYSVDVIGDGSTAYHGVASELKLTDKAVSDFASRSRQTLILRTNTYRGKSTIPLSKLFKDGAAAMLNPVDEADAAEEFDKNAESTAERYIVTGNLLRGWNQAIDATKGRDQGRPRVAIFTRHAGDLATGVLMPPGWQPGAAESGVTPIDSVDAFVAAVASGRPIKSTAGRVWIHGQRVSIPANSSGRMIWGDPGFRAFFPSVPVQQGGKMVGTLGDSPATLAGFFEFLKSRGVNLSMVEAQSGDAHAMASRGAFATVYSTGPSKVPTTVPVRFGGMDLVRPIELPELVRFVRTLTSDSPRVGRAGKLAMGKFQGGEITLDPGIFRDPDVAAKVLAHEIGHLVDWLPDGTTARGNLIGRLRALRKFLKATFGNLTARDLRAELLDVTRWWRPYDPVVDPPSYVRYRETPEELFADALGVLFNAPAELEARAPKFYKAFWENIDQRPEVRDALFELQDLLARGHTGVIAAREQAVEAAFAEGEKRWREAVANREAESKSWDGWWTRLWQELYWNFYPLERMANQVERRGVRLNLRDDPRAFLDDLGYRDVTVMRWGRTIFEKVVQPIEQAGMTLDDLGKLLLYERIVNGDRSGLANPGGLSPKSAALGLLKLNLDLGINRMTILRAAAKRFHEEVFKLAQQAVEVGAYNRQTFKAVIEPNRDSYATFAVLDYLDDWIPAGIRDQIGTLKDVANPFQATILKSIALIHLIAYQQAKIGTVAFLGRYFPDEIERWVGAPGDRPPARKGRGILMRLENGRPAYYYVDPYIADAFEKGNTRQLWWLVRAADSVFRNFVYPFIITYNPGFLLFLSPTRDLQRTGRNLPGQFQRVRLLRDYLANIREVWRRYRGAAGPLIREMEANLGLGTPFDQISRSNRNDFLADLLRRMRVMPDHAIRGFLRDTVLRPIRGLLDGLEASGMTLDALTKVAAYARLRRSGLIPKAAAHWVRNYAGLPNINKRGLVTRQLRALIPFWNVFVQGWRADARLMTNPTTRSGWWFKYMTTNGLARVIGALAASGALGALLKELFDGVGEYDKTNYQVMPVGQVPGGEFGNKTVFIRIPESETDRLIGGIISKGIRSMAGDDVKLSGIMDFGMGQIPTLNPAITVPEKWAEFAAGQNPRDPFTGRDIVPRREWAAGGWNSVQPMAVWTLGQSGALNFFRYDPQADTTMQVVADVIPGVNRMIKVSDQGYRESQRADQTEEEAQRARVRLGIPSRVQGVEMEFWHLARLKESLRTEAQRERYDLLRGWYRTIYLPAWESIVQAQEAGRTDEAAAISRALAVQTEPYAVRSQ